MDNILLSTLIGLFAAFLTAILGFTKLINDKEAKTSEFRQQWTGSIRVTIANIVSSSRHLAVLYEKHAARAFLCKDLKNELLNFKDLPSVKYDIVKETHDFNVKLVESYNTQIIEINRIIRENIALSVLHFKPLDHEFHHVETKLKSILDLIDDISITSWNSVHDKTERKEYLKSSRAKIENLCDEIVSISRLLLKKEWELIKSGEKNYIKTKKVFKYGSVLVAGIIFVIFTYFFIAKYSATLANEKINSVISNAKTEQLLHSKTPPIQCPTDPETATSKKQALTDTAEK